MKKLDFSIVERLLRRPLKLPFAKSWIEQKIDKHKEPKRKGMPRNIPRPFPSHKYAAVCIHIVYDRLAWLTAEHVGKIVGASPALIRNWRRDERFNHAVDKERREFALHFVEEFLGADTTKRKDLDSEMVNYSGPVRKLVSEEMLNRFLASQEQAECQENASFQEFFFERIIGLVEDVGDHSEEEYVVCESARELNRWHTEQLQKAIESGDSRKALSHQEKMTALADKWLEVAFQGKAVPEDPALYED